MLDKELWKKLPMSQGSVPHLAGALQGSRHGLLAKPGSTGSLAAGALQNGDAAPAATDGFDAWMIQGNPWRSNQGRPCYSIRRLIGPL